MSIDYLAQNAARFDGFDAVDGDARYWPGPPVSDTKKWELVVPDEERRLQFTSLGRLQAALATEDPRWTRNAVYCVTSGRVSRAIHERLAGRAIRKCRPAPRPASPECVSSECIV